MLPSNYIVLTKGKKALVDGDMYEILNAMKWCSSQRYAMTSIRLDFRKYKMIPMHHFVCGKPLHGYEIDHINGDGLDNRRTNLRVVTHRQNANNFRKHRNGKLPGATFGCGNWQARIYVSGKRLHLGRFKTQEDAHIAYLKAWAELSNAGA